MSGHERPNILFIMDDQHRHDYLGCAGASFVSTPNIDSIAASGVRFTQCATNSPLCAPSRIGLATGMLPSRLGCLDNNCYLPSSATTFYQRLRDEANYRVGCVGKLDLAKPDGYNGRYGDRPAGYRFGFTHPEECEGKMHAGHSATPIGPYTHYLEKQGLLQTFHEDYERRSSESWVELCHDSVLPTEAFEDVYIGRRSAEWIDGIADDFPWFLFVSFVGPHDPYDPPTEYAGQYRDAAMPEAIPTPAETRRVGQRHDGITPEKVLETRRQYCAAITAIDDQVGEILSALRRRGMEENTVVVFASDHGEMLGDHGRYTKSTPHESAVRVPLMVSGPGIEAGRTSDSLVELNDLNPTVCELAGLEDQSGIDARSFAGLLEGSAEDHRAVAVSELHGFRVARTAAHKAVDYTGGGVELFDLEADPDEQVNVAKEDRGTLRKLRGALRERYLEGKWNR